MMNTIHEIAQAARIWAEVAAIRYKCCEELTGMCAIASSKLFTDLTNQGYEAFIAINKDESHAFVLVGSTVIDVTATQFSDEYSPVMIFNEADTDDFDIWEVGVVFRSVEALRKYQNTSGWPKCQIIKEVDINNG